MSRAYYCEICDERPHWRLNRIGDGVVTWACSLHLVIVCRLLQRDGERTELLVTLSRSSTL